MKLTCPRQPASPARGIALALLATTSFSIATLSAAPAYAQEAASYDIAAGPLPTVLNQFARQAHVELIYDAPLTQSATSPGLKGSFGAAEGLSRILAGTGLTYRQTGPKVFTLERAPTTEAGAVQLGPVRVEGSGDANAVSLTEQRANENPNGPGIGYVASRTTTGAKTNSPIVEIPQSISVVTRQQMNDLMPADINQALRYTVGIAPEIRGVDSHGQGGFSMSMRGFSPDFYMDGLKVDYNIDVFDAFLVDRVEVLSGPASVLYGQASPGGFVNIVSKLPTATPIHQVQFVVGSYGQFRGNLDLGGQLSNSGDLLYRLVVTGLTSGSQVDQVHTKRVSVAPALTWNIGSSTTLTVSGKYIKNFDIGPGTQFPVFGTVLPNSSGNRIPTSFYLGDRNYDHNPETSKFIGYTLEHRFSDSTFFKQNFRYGQSTDSGQRLQLQFVLFPSPDTTDLLRTGLPYSDNIKTLTLDNQIGTSIRLGTATLDLLAGLDYQRFHEYSTIGYDYSAPSIDYTDPVYGISLPVLPVSERYRTNSHLDQLGGYGQATLKWGGLRLMLGGRYDHATIDTTSLSPGDDATPSFSHTSRNKFTWRAGAVYLFENGLAPYASYTTSFQPQVGVVFDGRPYKPTLGEQYEAGLKFQPVGFNGFFTAALYHLVKQNVLSDDPQHPGFSIETGEIRARGVELSAHASLSNNLNFVATYAYTDARITKSDTISFGADGNFGPILGKRPYDVPKNSASFLADYTIKTGPLSGLGFNGGVRYIGPQYGDDTNTFHVKGYTLFDAGLRFDLASLSQALSGATLQINANNLFDKTYVGGCNGPNFCYWGERRNITGTVSYKW